MNQKTKVNVAKGIIVALFMIVGGGICYGLLNSPLETLSTIGFLTGVFTVAWALVILIDSSFDR